ncbi:Chorismate synthase [Candidatus Bilamarchaeum dharawalense]|uniref:Chorismate synthase n=1 Tax=Candidatus Bilamarchaeum dharawalense TaxID=2885759 RepID=A0A5E4LPJ7_9ARCH|nr:Chorismate synthase [Candidatus Bilamarchaeum dharawalense]
MNTFGRLFRISIFGESHGPCVGVVIDGCPAGLPLNEQDFREDLQRRRGGAKGTTPRKEDDLPLIKSGVFNGKTTGAPIAIEFENKNVDSSSYEKIKNTPRPGHADLVASQKFHGLNDYRGGGHFSGRLTVALVAAGVVAKKIIAPARADARLIEVGGSKIEDAMKEGDSVGGVVECKVNTLPVGLGEPFFDSVESLISHLVFAVPAIKGIEFGTGFACTKMKGSECNDAILDVSGKTATNNAGGINGGITNGNELVFRIAVKPTSSINKPGRTVDLTTGKQTEIQVDGRHDGCIALRMPVIVEAATAIVLADLMLLEK